MPTRINELNDLVGLTIVKVTDTDDRMFPPYPSKDRIAFFLKHEESLNVFYALFSYSPDGCGIEIDTTPESELKVGDRLWLGFISEEDYKRLVEEETRKTQALIENREIEDLHKLISRYPEIARNLVSQKE